MSQLIQLPSCWTSLSVQLRGTLISVAGICILSPDTLLIRLVGNVDDWTVMFYRYFLQGAVMMAIYFCLEGRAAPAKMLSIGWLGFAAGLIWGASNILFTAAVQNTAVANVLIILAGGDITFSALLSWLVLGEPCPRHTIVCCACCFAAILLVFADQLDGAGGGLKGNILAIFASLTLAAYFVAIRLASNVAGKAPDMIPCNCVAGLFVGFVSLCFGALPTRVQPDMSALFLIIQGLLVLPLAFTFLTIGPSMIPAAEVSMIMLIETIVGPVWVYLGGYEAPPTLTVYGGIILVVSLIVHSFISLRLEAAEKVREKEGGEGHGDGSGGSGDSDMDNKKTLPPLKDTDEADVAVELGGVGGAGGQGAEGEGDGEEEKEGEVAVTLGPNAL